MSVIKGKKLQLGYDGTASNNFTLYQPGTPDGTLKLANGIAGAETDLITLTSAGNVGIGISSPSTYVGASGGLVVAQDVTLVNNTTQPANNYPRFLQISGIGPSISGYQFTVNTGGNASTAPTERMRIDNSGRVTMPYQPAFAVTDLTFPSGTAGQGTGGTIVSNVGSCYNSSNGRFTAPVSGTYLFGLSVQAFNSGSTTYINVALGVNGSSTVGSFVSGYGAVHNNHMQITGSVIKYLNANDYAQIHVDYGARSGAQSIFNGFLIG